MLCGSGACSNTDMQLMLSHMQYIYIEMHTHIGIHAYMHVYNVYIYIYVRMSVCKYVRTYVAYTPHKLKGFLSACSTGFLYVLDYRFSGSAVLFHAVCFRVMQ